MDHLRHSFGLSASFIPFLLLVATSSAFAQNADPVPAPAVAEKAATEAADVEEIVVTGSLIARANNVSVSPIVSVTNEVIKQAGTVDLEATLNQLPGFTAAGTSGTGGQGTGGRASVSLHGLGSNRNLVLLDGKRLPISDISGNVDINILPEAIIGNIDVITGGASAVYGSDAMSGVVNFKTIKGFEGIKADVQVGDSFKGDYRKFNSSLTFGSNFSENRGNFLFAISYTTRQALPGDSRAFFADKIPSSFIGTGTYVPNATNLPTQAVLNSIFTSYGVTSTIGRTLNLGFNDNGSLFTQTGAINYKGPTTGGYGIFAGNVRMPVGSQIDILNSLKRKTAFAKFDYDLTDGMTAYGQFMYVDSTVRTESGGSLTQLGALTTIPVTNPFIPTDLRTLLASRPNPTANFLWNGRYVGIADKAFNENYQVQQYMGGLKGDITGLWKFDAFVSFDQSTHNQDNSPNVLKSRVQTLLSAADGGNSICAGGFNPFGIVNSTRISEACKAYMTKTVTSKEHVTQTQAQATINGSLFDLPAGPVQLAVLASYRSNSYRFVPDSDLAAGNVEAVIASAAVPKSKISVKELAAQIDVPIITDKTFFQELAVGAAGRISDYNTSGSVKSYEGDIRWRPVESLLFRASYQRAVRAPNIQELFSPATGIQVALGTPPGAIGDPCDVRSTARTGANGAQVRTLCISQGIPVAAIDTYQFPTTATGGVLSGNLALTPEKAKTYNIGAIFNSHASSSWLSDLSLSVDYYNIKIANVVSTVPGLTSLSKCYNLDGSNPTYSNANIFCQQLARNSSGQLDLISQKFLNLGALQTDGVEVQFNWGIGLSDMGIGSGGDKVYINSAIGWLNHYKRQTLPGSAIQDFGGTSTIGLALATWKALTTFGYRSERVGFGLRWRYQGPQNDITSVTTPATPAIGVKAYNLYDLFGSLRVSDNFEFRGGITNLFNKGLPVVASSQNLTDVAVYDAVGRSFYVGLKVGF
jgi:iron complex outermembrane recepter protein